jgi:hypothetical protein
MGEHICVNVGEHERLLMENIALRRQVEALTANLDPANAAFGSVAQRLALIHKALSGKLIGTSADDTFAYDGSGLRAVLCDSIAELAGRAADETDQARVNQP